MTLLQIDKRAESAEEGEELINRSLGLRTPFDVPVLCITNQDYADWHNKTKSVLTSKPSSLVDRAWHVIDGEMMHKNLKFGFVEQKVRDLFTSKPMQDLSLKDRHAAGQLLWGIGSAY